MTAKKRILSGMRPTGRLHLGHLVGALSNWVKLQESYHCFYMIADWHALMSEYENPKGICENSYEMVKNFVAAGLDPDKSVIFIQSHVPEHLELYMVFSDLTPLGWVERCPTYKEQLREIKGRDLTTYGFLGYPVLQAADILIYKADRVPVGKEEIPLIDLTNDIAEKFRSKSREMNLTFWRKVTPFFWLGQPFRNFPFFAVQLKNLFFINPQGGGVFFQKTFHIHIPREHFVAALFQVF